MSDQTLFQAIEGNPTAIGQLADILAKIDTMSALLQRTAENCLAKHNQLQHMRAAMKPHNN